MSASPAQGKETTMEGKEAQSRWNDATQALTERPSEDGASVNIDVNQQKWETTPVQRSPKKLVNSSNRASEEADSWKGTIGSGDGLDLADMAITRWSIEAVAAERSGTTPIRDGHLSSGAVLCRGWSGRYCDGAGQSRAGFGAIFRAVTLKHWKFQSEGVVWSSSRKPELQSGQRRTTSFCGTLTMRLQR
ncbi:hypothetical protein JHK84_045269 [Glycine max]|nr:hypothetical protein JHK84_045269 [Glycine max]